VGGGLAGGIIASTLAAAGHSVTLLEQGTAPAPLVPTDETWEGGGLKSTFTRGEGVGGSSNYWHGGLITLDRSDVEGAFSGGSKFPISYEELNRYYARALALMTDGEITLADLQPRTSREAPLPLDETHFELKPLVFPSIPFSTRPMLERAESEHGLEIVLFQVERLVFANSGVAAAAEGIDLRTGSRRQIAADLFVVCAGGIGSPKILLRTVSAAPTLARLPIGRNLIDHPTGFVFKARLRRRVNLKSMFGARCGRSGRFRRRWGIKLRPEHLGVSAERNHVLYLRPAFSMRNPRDYNALKNKLVGYRGRSVSLWDKLRLLRYFDLLVEAVNFRWGLVSSVSHVAGFVFAEQLPDSTDRISLRSDGNYAVHWTIRPDDETSLRQFLTAFFERHAESFRDYVFFPGLLDSGAHHSGACRMADNPADGVVDEGFRVFGTQNVFVADASVLAFHGHANTGLTIAAMALRCCDVLRADADHHAPRAT